MGILDMLFGPRVTQISVVEAQKRLTAEHPPLIVDVRQPAEVGTGSVPGAIFIPLTEFGRRYHELPQDRPILTICRSSHRSPMAARQLQKAGYDVVDVAGGMQAWQAAGLPTQRS